MRKNILISLAVAAALAAPLAHADAGDTTLGGVIYADFTTINTQNAGKDVDPNGFGVDVSRAYLIVNHQFDDIWSANLTTDFNFASFKNSCTVTGGAVGETCSVTTTTPQNQIFVKKAYIQGKFDDLALFRIGSADMPWIPYAEGVYGYRFVEKTLIDREGFGQSADWGLHLSGANGMFNYQVSAVNGGGYKNPTRSKTMDLEARAGVTMSGFIIEGGLYTGELGQDTETHEAAAVGIKKNTASRENLLVAWKGMGATVGLEYFSAENFNSSFIFSNTTDKEDGFSVYGSYDFPGSDWGVYARYDNVKPKKDTDSTLKDTYYNLGASWKANKSVTWAFGVKSDELKDDTSIDLKTVEYGVWAQIKY